MTAKEYLAKFPAGPRFRVAAPLLIEPNSVRPDWALAFRLHHEWGLILRVEVDLESRTRISALSPCCLCPVRMSTYDNNSVKLARPLQTCGNCGKNGSTPHSNFTMDFVGDDRSEGLHDWLRTVGPSVVEGEVEAIAIAMYLEEVQDSWSQADAMLKHEVQIGARLIGEAA